MRYHTEEPSRYVSHYGTNYACDHPVYNCGTLYRIRDRGIVVIQQRYDKTTKQTSWGPIDPWLTDTIYLNHGFLAFFNSRADEPDPQGLYPTISVRQIMWALKIKPLRKEVWETVFDRKSI